MTLRAKPSRVFHILHSHKSLKIWNKLDVEQPSEEEYVHKVKG